MHRADNQVKVRGFRIELGEVESVLAHHAAVAQTAVIVREDQPGDQRLVAYVVLEPGYGLTITEMRKHLRAQLPNYMIPQHLVEMTALPLTPNGKIDRKSLPLPMGTVDSGSAFETPANESESYLARTWAKLLNLEQVSVNDNFFDVGGHSLLAARMAIQVKEETGISIPLNAV